MKSRPDKNSTTAAVAGFQGPMGSIPLPEGVVLRSDEERVIWEQFTRARARADWRDMDLLLLAKVVRLEADSDRPVKSLWRTRSSAITTRLSRRAQRQQGRVRQTLTLGRASVEFLSGIVGEDRQDAGRGDC
jgi:hypothetical protein